MIRFECDEYNPFHELEIHITEKKEEAEDFIYEAMSRIEILLDKNDPIKNELLDIYNLIQEAKTTIKRII